MYFYVARGHRAPFLGWQIGMDYFANAEQKTKDFYCRCLQPLIPVQQQLVACRSQEPCVCLHLIRVIAKLFYSLAM